MYNRKLQTTNSSGNTDTGTTSSPNNSGNTDEGNKKDACIPAKTIAGFCPNDRWVYAVLFTVVGPILCFWGLKWWALFAWVCGGFAGLYVYNMFRIAIQTDDNVEVYVTVIWYIIAGAFVIAFAFLFALAKRLSTGLTGLLGGFIIADTIKIFVLVFVTKHGENITTIDIPGWIWSISMISLAIVGFIYGCWQPEYIVILVTSFLGGRLMIQGLGLFCGWYPESFYDDKFYFMWYVFFGLQIVCQILGFFIQRRAKKIEDVKNNAINTFKQEEYTEEVY